MNRYSTEEKQQAIDLYFKNGCNMKKTVRELGYGSATGILRWLRETVPDKVSKSVQRNWKVDYPEEIKQAEIAIGTGTVAHNVSLLAQSLSP